MPTIDLPQGRLEYRVDGPDDSSAPPVVFVHGVLVNGELWAGTAAALADRGIRSYTLELPLGAHRIPLGEDADLTPRGVARLIVDALAALGLEDVTLVGNDTGGGLCQFAIDADPSRVGRLVLTNCDAFEKFPPPPFGMLNAIGRRPGRLRFFMRTARPTFMRHSALAYGGLVRDPLDPELTARWVRPLVEDKAVARDAARFLGATDKRDMLDVSTRLSRFTKPVLLVWGAADRFFRIDLAQRLADAFPDSRLVRIEDGKTFVPLDDPERLADEVASFTRAPAT